MIKKKGKGNDSLNKQTLQSYLKRLPARNEQEKLSREELENVASDITNSADLFLTGPLSGCNIYLATRAGSPPMVFHGNANANSSSVPLNNAAKDAEADKIAGEKGYTITHRLARGQYELPAFVWGYRFDTSWALFVHEFNVATRAPTNRPLGTK